MNPVWLYTSALTFLCGFDFGTSLKCYSCQIIEGITDKSCESPVECPHRGPSLCYSTSYTWKYNENEKQAIIVKDCIERSQTDECKELAELSKMELPGFKVDFAENCYTCDTDGCNRGSGSTKASLALFVTLSMASLLWSVVDRS